MHAQEEILNSYDSDDFESTLRYLMNEYGIECLAGRGKNPGMINAVSLMHDFFNTRFHANEYNLLKLMEQAGILRVIFALKDSGKSEAECVSELNACVNILHENFIRMDIAEKYVNIIASVAGLTSRANISANSTNAFTPAPQRRQPTTPKHPAMNDGDFLALCESENAVAVEEALKNGANANARSILGRALHHAIEARDAETVEVLLRYGAKVNAKNSVGWTALHLAACKGETESAEVLLRYGANVNAQDDNGLTALTYAEMHRHSDLARLLRSYGAR